MHDCAGLSYLKSADAVFGRLCAGCVGGEVVIGVRCVRAMANVKQPGAAAHRSRSRRCPGCPKLRVCGYAFSKRQRWSAHAQATMYNSMKAECPGLSTRSTPSLLELPASPLCTTARVS